MIKEDVKFSDSNVLEGMTSISALLNSDPLVNDRSIIKIQIDENKRKKKSPEIGFLIAKSHELGFPLEFVDTTVIERSTVGTSHGGIIALCTDRHFQMLTEEQLKAGRFYVYLEGIEDPYNFGNAIRSLYASGVDGIIIPPRNWMSAAGVVARASAGSSERLPFYIADAETASTVFHRAGYRILCAGIRDSVSVFDADLSYPLLLVIGGEKRGISRNLLDSADQILRIDYDRDFRGSLSASASAAVLGFEIMRKNKY